MKPLRSSVYIGTLLLVLLAACAPQSGSNVNGASTPITVPQSPTSTAAPVLLSGPPMQVGSTYPYVDGTILVAVPGGPFTMGHGGSDNPEHQVTLSDFWIYSTKVTNQQYAWCVKTGQCTAPAKLDDPTYTDFAHLNDPVVGVTWAQAADYCTFVHGVLPTEAQWEKTARGPNANLYPWGNNAPVCDVLNYNNCVGKITSVVQYPQGASFYSALDMEGNTFEWVSDWYDALYYNKGPAQDPLGPDSGKARSVRSASYRAKPDQVPASTRFFANPLDHRRDLGFRCVVLDPTYFAPFCSQLSFFGVDQNGKPGNGTINFNCPDVHINPQPQTCKDQYTYVTVSDNNPDDPNAHVTGLDPPGCTLISGSIGHYPQVYKCTTEPTASIDSVCTVQLGGNASCAAHYNMVGNSCEWDGTGTQGKECLPGYTYDPVMQCCATTSGAAQDYPLCGAGLTLFEDSPGHYMCLPNAQAPNPPSDKKQVLLPAQCSESNNSCDPSTTFCGCPEGQTYYCPAAGYGKCYCR